MSYVPQNPHEKAYFDMLWEIANNRPVLGDPSAELAGLTAVNFFQRSGVDKGFLKQIWSLSTPAATMNANQFYSALRYIAMIQNGEIPISAGKTAWMPAATLAQIVLLGHVAISGIALHCIAFVV